MSRKSAYVGAGGVHRRAHRIGEQVVLPAERLHEQHAAESVDGGLLEDLVVVRDVGRALRGKAILGAGAGDKVLVAFDGHGGFVVGVVAGAPGVIGDEDEGVHGVPDEVVDPGVVRERTVAGFVRHAPPTREDDTLPVPVEGPERPLDGAADSSGNTVVSDERLSEAVDLPAELVYDDCTNNIAGSIGERLERVPLVEVFRDHGVNFLEGDL